MEVKQFHVCRHGREARWVVRLNKSIYGSYLNKEQALLDAVDAARDSQQTGCAAQVWLRERTTSARIF